MDEKHESAEELTENPAETPGEAVAETEAVETDAEAPSTAEGVAGEVSSEESAGESEAVEGTAAETAEEADAAELIAEDDSFSLPRVLEAILFASQKPVSLKELQNFCKSAAQSNPENSRVAAFAKLKEATVREAFEKLQAAYAAEGRSFEVRETATGWQLVTRPDFAPWLRQLFPENRPARLSAPAVETLAIIAYRQPITRADIEAVRGVAVDGVMQSLLDRELIKIAGRAEVPGRPLLYETTSHFMEHFGLRDLDELPNGAELRRAKLPTAAPAEEPAVAETPAGESTSLIDETAASGEDAASSAETEISESEPPDEITGESPERENRDEQH